ncbi:septin 4a isoform X2 [Platichthys flesus]|uniref:septin 4a isoform X2 n=1 Tax=Platichthys flesus TaxID=8260 RepID=UPI002DBDB153|nr:septin 4a isoform X2 [Platichthys flesus]
MQHMSSPVRFRNHKKAATLSEFSSLSIDDQEDTQFPFAMRDLPGVSQVGDQHQEPGHQMSVNHGAEGPRATTNGRRPSLPGTPPPARPIPCHPTSDSPTAPQRPHRAGVDSGFQSLPLRKQLVSQTSLDSTGSSVSRPHSPWGRFDPYDSPEDQDKEYVGFATLPNQVHRKTVKKGFTFTLMVAGESGLGKSTLINSLFLTDLYKDRKVPNAEGEATSRITCMWDRFTSSAVIEAGTTYVALVCLSAERIGQTVDITKHTVSIEEKGIKLRLTIIDTPGFGDAVNNSESWRQIEDYIDEQFEKYFRDESGLNRRNIQDNRVHCCLYFISPFGHGLRPLDVECMKAIHEKVNIVPILAKADSLTQAEICRKKRKIQEEMKQFGINIYQFPECDSDEDEDFKTHDQLLKDSIPFAVIGGNVQVESKGRRFRGRLYPWGVVEVENPAHSDFLLLRNMLVRTHMQDLKDVTRESHYENYRAQCIQNMTRMVVQEKQRSLREKFQEGSEDNFPLPLAAVDSEKERLIFEKDEELRRMQEVFERIQEQMQHSHRGGC